MEHPIDHLNIEQRAAEFLQRRRFWPWSDQDQQDLEDWLNQHIQHRVSYLRLESGLHRVERLAALGPMKRPITNHTSDSAWFTKLAKYAAAILLLVGLGIAGQQMLLRPGVEYISTQIGDRRIITLADGSKVELNTNTKLRISRHGPQREVWLDKGEAYFDIVHSETEPFLVHVGKHLVTDLGTKFSVTYESDKTKVALVEGAARIDAVEQGANVPPAYLTPGDVALATDQAISVSRETQSNLAHALAWRRGMLIFNRTTLADAAAQFNRYNPDKLVITDKKIASLTMNGSFPNKDIAGFSAAIRDIFKVHVEQTQGKIFITQSKP